MLQKNKKIIQIITIVFVLLSCILLIANAILLLNQINKESIVNYAFYLLIIAILGALFSYEKE